MAVKYLAGDRLIGTAAERLALSGDTLTAVPQTSWKELSRYTLTGGSDTINVGSPDNAQSGTDGLGTGNFAAKDNLMIISHIYSNDTIHPKLRFNGTTSSDDEYASRVSTDGGTDWIQEDEDSMRFGAGTTNTDQFIVTTIRNQALQEKLAITNMTFNAGSSFQREETVGKWANSGVSGEQIVNIQIPNGQTSGDFASGSEVVVLGCDDDEANSGTNFWEEIADVEVSSGSTIDTGTFTAKKYLWLELYTVGSGSQSYSNIQFNSDTGSNYHSGYSTNGGGDNTGSGSYILFYAPMANFPRYMTGLIVNKSDEEKLLIGNGVTQNTAGANAVERRELWGKWTRKTGSGTGDASASITSIQIISSSGSFTTGTRLRVWGKD